MKALFTGPFPLNVVFESDNLFAIEEVRLHLSGVASGGGFTIALESVHGPEYNVLFVTQVMAGVEDYVYQPPRPHQFDHGDKVLFNCPGSGPTYGLEIDYKGKHDKG